MIILPQKQCLSLLQKILPLFFLSFFLIFACDSELPDNEYPEAPSWLQEIPLAIKEEIILVNYHLPVVTTGKTLQFRALQEGEIQCGINSNPEADEPESWLKQSSLTLNQEGKWRVFARLIKNGASQEPFWAANYTVLQEIPSFKDYSIKANSPQIKNWADSVILYNNIDASSYTNPEEALGPAESDSFSVCSLGNGGSITLFFTQGIKNGPGFDFAVFENGFKKADGSIFMELAFVEVSSDGENFIRFDNLSLLQEPVNEYQSISDRTVFGLAGQAPNSGNNNYGCCFDLNWLVKKEEVFKGQVDLQNIQYVRIRDINGNPDNTNSDSFDQPIYDPWPSQASTGFDLDAIAVINQP